MTTIYLQQTTRHELKRLAKKEKKPMSQIVREFIDEGLITRSAPKTNFLKKLSKYRVSVKAATSQQIDDVVYGK